MAIVCHSRERHILCLPPHVFPITHVNTDICFTSPGKPRYSLRHRHTRSRDMPRISYQRLRFYLAAYNYANLLKLDTRVLREVWRENARAIKHVENVIREYSHA
jgi:hypothetical protein